MKYFEELGIRILICLWEFAAGHPTQAIKNIIVKKYISTLVIYRSTFEDYL
jgi:hypothetical protein